MGPWVPSLDVFLLSCLHCPVRGTGAATPRAPLTSVRPCFQGFPGHFIHRVVLNLGFTLIILHVVLGYFHRTPGAVSPHALCCLIVPSRFLWSLVRGLVSKGFPLVQQRLARAARGLVVSSTSPLHPSACCACKAISPELGCSSRRLANDFTFHCC